MRLAKVVVTKDLIREWLIGNFIQGLHSTAPDDLEVVEVREDRFSPRVVNIIVSSNTLDECLEFCDPPIMTIEYSDEP